LDRPVDKVTLKLYTKSMMVADQAQTGPAGPGWVGLAVPPSFASHAVSGNYYFVVEVERRGELSRKHGIGDMFILK